MTLQIYERNGAYVVLQKQRLDTSKNGNSYETCEVGTGSVRVTPSGELYLEVKINGISDNQKEYGRAKE